MKEIGIKKKIEDCMPYIKKEVIVYKKESHSKFRATIAFHNNKLYWREKLSEHSIKKYKFIPVNKEDEWQYPRFIEIPNGIAHEIITQINVFVSKLTDNYISYGIMGIKNKIVISDGTSIIPIMGSILINTNYDTEKQDKLKEIISNYYSSSDLVKDVYFSKYHNIIVLVRDEKEIERERNKSK